VIQIYLEANQNEILMDLFMKQDYRLNTILNILIHQKNFNLMENILRTCENINKRKLIDFVMLLDDREATILHNVVSTDENKFKALTTNIVEQLFNIFDEKEDEYDFIKFITRCKFNWPNELPLIKLIDKNYCFKIIWRYIKVMAIAPEEYLQPIDCAPVRSSLKRFGPNIFFDNNDFTLKQNLINMVKKYEILNIFKVCNFVGKYKVLQITAFDRFKI